MKVRGTTVHDVQRVMRLVDGRTWLPPEMVTVAIAFGGGLSRVLERDGEILAVLLAGSGACAEEGEPDWDDEKNVDEETDDWIGPVDLDGEPAVDWMDPPSFAQDDGPVIWDVIGDDSELLLQDFWNHCYEHGKNTLMWVERPETTWWSDLLRKGLLPVAGGAAGSAACLPGVGDVGFIVSFGDVPPLSGVESLS